MPSLNCPTPVFNGRVGGYTMPEMGAWGQEAWNWIANCHNSILDASEKEGQ